MLQSLKTFLSMHHLTSFEKLSLASSICINLNQLHNKNMNHGNLNLDTILMKFEGPYPSVYILKSDVSQVMSPYGFRLAAATGEPAFWAPELNTAEPVKRYYLATDIYALGKVFEAINIPELVDVMKEMLRDVPCERPDLNWIMATCHSVLMACCEPSDAFTDDSDFSDEDLMLPLLFNYQSHSRERYLDEADNGPSSSFYRNRARSI